MDCATPTRFLALALVAAALLTAPPVRAEEEVYAVTMDCKGFDTGNVLSWLEANVALALETEEFGSALRDSLEDMLK